MVVYLFHVSLNCIFDKIIVIKVVTFKIIHPNTHKHSLLTDKHTRHMHASHMILKLSQQQKVSWFPTEDFADINSKFGKTASNVIANAKEDIQRSRSFAASPSPTFNLGSQPSPSALAVVVSE